MELPITDPVLVFATVMLIVLLAPLLFQRLGIPGIVGLIVTGAVVGPNALGLLQRGDTFELLGTVGLLYLMFTAGLSLDLNQFSQYKSRSLTFGLTSFFVPQLLALFLGQALLGYDLPAALLLGSVVGSHTLLAYPIAERLGITKNLAVTMTMGGTMVTDLISLLILAAVSASVAGSTGLWFWVLFVVLVTGYGAAVFLGLPRLGRWFFRGAHNEADIEFVFLLAVVFVTAYVAQVVYLAPIIGAFMAGIALNRLVPERSALMLRIKFVGDALFIPFFLISVGMLVDGAALIEGLDVWVAALLFTGLVWVGKLVAAKLVQWGYRYTSEEGWTIFGLSTPQAAATLAVTLVGFEIGLFDETTVNAVIVMILFTCLMGPWLVERFGREVALQEKEKPYEPTSTPQRILIPLANPETAEALVDLAVLMRAPTSDQPIYPATVVRDGPEVEQRVAEGEALLGHAIVHAAAADVPVAPITRIDLNVAHGIVRAIKEERISTVIIGWSGHSSARRVIFGTVLDQLLDETREMVIVSKIARPPNTHRRVLVAVPPLAEREPGFGAAVRALKTFASQTGEELIVLAVESATDVVMDRVRRTAPEVPVQLYELAQWAGLVSALDELAAPSDLIVLISERKGSLVWRPSLDRLPGALAQRFSENSLLTVYMSEQPVETLPAYRGALTERRMLAEAIPQNGIVLGLDEVENGVLEYMLEYALRERPESVARLVSLLAGSDSAYAPEVMPGVALYHAHTNHVDETLLLVGISREGVQLPSAAQPVYAVLVFLGHPRLSSETYLRRLTAAADVVRTPEMVETLRQCKTPEEVRALLSGQVQAGEVE